MDKSNHVIRSIVAVTGCNIATLLRACRHSVTSEGGGSRGRAHPRAPVRARLDEDEDEEDWPGAGGRLDPCLDPIRAPGFLRKMAESAIYKTSMVHKIDQATCGPFELWA